MTATDTTASTSLVAIDISKHRHEVLIGVPGKKRRRRLTILNTLEDFKRLSATLASYDLPVRIGFEATGNYHRTVAHHLGRAGFELKLVSSVGLARTREALHNSWDKNDPKDAQVILHMLEIGAVQFFHDPMVFGTVDLQELSKTHEIVSRSKTELWHRILIEMPMSRAVWAVSNTPEEIRAGILPSEQMLEHMITAQPRIMSSEWMLIGRQVDTDFGGWIDLLALAPDGSLVLVELKRDRTPREVVAQALDCAALVEGLAALMIPVGACRNVEQGE